MVNHYPCEKQLAFQISHRYGLHAHFSHIVNKHCYSMQSIFFLFRFHSMYWVYDCYSDTLCCLCVRHFRDSILIFRNCTPTNNDWKKKTKQNNKLVNSNSLMEIVKFELYALAHNEWIIIIEFYGMLEHKIERSNLNLLFHWNEWNGVFFSVEYKKKLNFGR